MDLNSQTIFFALISLIALFTVIIIAFLIFVKLKTAKSKKQINGFGRESEIKIDKLLKDSFGEDNVLSGFYLPYIKTDKDKLAEIDHLVILRSGVFVIEVKSHNGFINCPDAHDWWQTYNDKKVKFYNPIRQNGTHVRVLNDILKSKGQYSVLTYNVVVFTSHKITFSQTYDNVISTNELISYIKKTGKRNAMSTSQTNRIRSIIKDNAQSGRKAQNKHKRSMNKY